MRERRLIDHAKPVTDNNAGCNWIPVAERLPENFKDYLCLCNVDGHTEYPFAMVLRYFLTDKKAHFQHESEHGLRVTHWMQIPEPPKEG